MYRNSSEFLCKINPSIDAVKKLLADGQIIFCKQANITDTEDDRKMIDKKTKNLCFMFLLKIVIKPSRIIN